MTTFEGRPNTALLVVDVQNDVVAGAWDRDGVIARPHPRPRRKARAEHVPVIWVQHSDDNMPAGSDGWQYVPELTRDESEPLVHKRYGLLRGHRPRGGARRAAGRRVVVTGAQTDACIRSTLHGALVRGYDTTLVEDAHTTEDLRQWGVRLPRVIVHTNVSWSWSEAPGRRATSCRRPTSTSARG